MDPAPRKFVTIEKLQLELVRASELRLAGTLESPTAQSELRLWLDRLHDSIVQQRLSSFTVDVRALNFVNSSSIRLFVNWIARAEAASYKIVFVIERGVTWHRLSFSVLQSLAPKCVEIREGTGEVRDPSSGRHNARK